MAVSRRGRIVFFDLGLVVVVLSLPLPWAEVAGRSRSGPAFANLLLRLPEVPMLGDHLTIVALLFYAIPLLALATWLTQFRSWPRELSRWSVVAAASMSLVVGLLVAWFALRGVGFPTIGPIVAALGAVMVLVATLLRSSPSSPPADSAPILPR